MSPARWTIYLRIRYVELAAGTLSIRGVHRLPTSMTAVPTGTHGARTLPVAESSLAYRLVQAHALSLPIPILGAPTLPEPP